jgi:hypothetical protein
MQSTRLILIEFNELCPHLLQRFMAQGMIPNFQRFYETASVFTTDAAEDPERLEPWIQWPTVHSGMPFKDHGVFHLGDGHCLEHKCMAELLSDAGINVGICGSMNQNYCNLRGYVIPDPWDKQAEAHPSWLEPFYRTVARQVQESSNDASLSRKQMASFGWFLLRHGLTVGTAAAILGQLVAERRDPGVRWRRACLLDRLQYDIFKHLNRRFDVRFATFFCNSTAHFQHYYWRNMEPENFEVPPPQSDHVSLQDAIPYGYRAMDRLLSRFMADYPDALLMMCTALSQQTWSDTTKCTFRPRQFETFLEFARVRVDGASVKPVMAEQFHVECFSPKEAELAEQGFRDLFIEEEPLMTVRREGSNLFAGCRVTDTAVMDRPVLRRSDGARRPFGDLFHMVHSMRSGRHHSDGVLWVRNGKHRVVRDKVPLTAIAPTILAHFGLRSPNHMNELPLSV